MPPPLQKISSVDTHRPTIAVGHYTMVNGDTHIE